MYDKAVFLDFASIHPQDLDIDRLSSSVGDWYWYDKIAVQDIVEAVAGADVVVTNKVILDQTFFTSARSVKLVCAAATGFNNIDIQAARHSGVDVCNIRAYATPSVVQHVFSILLSLVTSQPSYRRDIYNGSWTSSDFFCLFDHPIRELQGLNIGIVGYGELGQAVAGVARAFGMKVLVAKRHSDDNRPGRIELHSLLSVSDVVSLHCPLTDTTEGLIGAEELSLMKPDAILINTARGGLVDEMALMSALQENRLGGAGLDVLEQEPPSANHPLIQQSMDNLIITPHCAWASRQSRQRLVDEIAENIRVFSEGGERNLVNGGLSVGG